MGNVTLVFKARRYQVTHRTDEKLQLTIHINQKRSPMKNSISKTVLAFASALCILATQSIYAQWTQTSGPFGGLMTTLNVSGSNLIAGTYGGVFYSSDNGLHWSDRSDGLTNLRVQALANSGNLLYAVAWNELNYTVDEVFRSTDLGLNWTKVSSNGLTNADIRCVCISGSYVFVGTTAGGVFRASTSGGNWTSVGLSNETVFAMTVSGSYILASTMNTQSSNGAVYRTANYGGKWSKSGGLSANVRIRTFSQVGSVLYAGGIGGVFSSTNNGGKWVAKNNGLVNNSNNGVPEVLALAGNGTTVYAGTGYDGSGVFWSSNGGSSWTQTALTSYIRSMAVIGTNVFAGAGGTAGSIYHSVNNGASWTTVNNGITARYVYGMIGNGSDILADGIYKSIDGGANWTAATISSTTESFFVYGTDIFAGSSSGLHRSVDGGTTWTQINGAMNYIKAFASVGTTLFFGVNHCCCSTCDGVYRSNDNGQTWTMVNNGLTSAKVEALAVMGTSLFAGTAGGGIFVSNDLGANWTATNTGLGNTSILSLAVHGSIIYAGTAGSGVYISANNGASWSWAGSGLTNSTVNEFAVSGSTVFAATNAGVFATTTNGSSWTDVSSGLVRSKSILSLAVAGTDLYAGTFGNSVWKRPLSQMPKRSVAVQTPTFHLEQNYPNPFNPSTTITYSIPENGVVTLRVYDRIGRMVAELENGMKESGTHSTLFDARELSSGIYFYRLEMNGQIRTGTMTLMK